MSKYFKFLHCFVIILFLAVYFVLPVAANELNTVEHAKTHESSETIMAHSHTDCMKQNNLSHSGQKHCSNQLCTLNCALHCINIVPLTIYQMNAPIVRALFESASEFKLKNSAIQPTPPPPKLT